MAEVKTVGDHCMQLFTEKVVEVLNACRVPPVLRLTFERGIMVG